MATNVGTEEAIMDALADTARSRGMTLNVIGLR